MQPKNLGKWCYLRRNMDMLTFCIWNHRKSFNLALYSRLLDYLEKGKPDFIWQLRSCLLITPHFKNANTTLLLCWYLSLSSLLSLLPFSSFFPSLLLFYPSPTTISLTLSLPFLFLCTPQWHLRPLIRLDRNLRIKRFLTLTAKEELQIESKFSQSPQISKKQF